MKLQGTHFWGEQVEAQGICMHSDYVAGVTVTDSLHVKFQLG